jgi:protein involved in polysaccharide export with SLBB domain
MNKVLMAAATTALALCALDASAAQGRNKVRVGPLADETARETPAGKEKKAGDAAASKPAKIERSAEANKDAKGESGNNAKSEPANTPARAGATDAGKKTVALSSNTSTPAPVGATVPTSDAPSRSTNDPVGPLLAPSKNDPVTTKTAPNNATTTTTAPASASPSPAVPSAIPSSNNKAANSTTDKTTTNTAAPANSTTTNAAVAPATSAPSPLMSVPPVTYSPAPVPAATAVYRIGVGDVLDIRLLNQASTRESTLYTVMAGGLLEYPLAGDALVVTGMTTEELGARLSLALKRRAVYDKPQLIVSVRDYASHTVLVSGMVSDPGMKVLRREAVPLYVVIAEAQPHADAGRALIISHATGQSQTVDLSDSAAMNVLVHAGDVVNVQGRPKEFLYMGGEIAQPGQKDFHSGLTLTQAVLASGGITRMAGAKIKVSRQGADGRLISTEYNLSEIETGVVPDPRLQPGDRVEVSRKR